MLEYLWISLNILENACIMLWLCEGSEYAQSSYKFDRLLKMFQVLNVSEFWIWHSCICKGYTEFWICLNMAQYALIMPEYALMSLNMPEHNWISLNIPEYVWIKCSDKARVLNMPHHVRYLRGFWICLRH